MFYSLNPSQSFLIILFSCICPQTWYRSSWSLTFPGTKVWLTTPQFLDSSFWLFLKMSATLSFLQLLSTSSVLSHCYNIRHLSQHPQCSFQFIWVRLFSVILDLILMHCWPFSSLSPVSNHRCLGDLHSKISDKVGTEYLSVIMAIFPKTTSLCKQVILFLVQPFPSGVAVEALVAFDIPCKCQVWMILITFVITNGEALVVMMWCRISLSP